METEVDFAVEAATEVEVEAEAEAVEVGLLQPVSITKLSNPIPSMFLVLLFMFSLFFFYALIIGKRELTIYQGTVKHC